MTRSIIAEATPVKTVTLGILLTAFVGSFSFTSSAMANSGGGGGMDFSAILPFLLILPIFYFFLLRPQQKKAKDHQALLKQLSKGDRILTVSGVFGTISKLSNEKEIQVEVADGVKITMLRSSVAQILRDDASAKAQRASSSSVTSLSEKGRAKQNQASPSEDTSGTKSHIRSALKSVASKSSKSMKN